MKWYQSDAGVQVVLFMFCAAVGWLVMFFGIIALIIYGFWMMIT
jgi:hypothetical protein